MKRRLFSAILGVVILIALTYVASESLTATADSTSHVGSDRELNGQCGAAATQPADPHGVFGCTCIHVVCIEGQNCCGELVNPKRCGRNGRGFCGEPNCPGICCQEGTGG